MENEHYETMGRTDFSDYDGESGWFSGNASYTSTDKPSPIMPEDSKLVNILVDDAA